VTIWNRHFDGRKFTFTYLLHDFFEGLEVEVFVEGVHLLHQRRRVERRPRQHHAALVTAKSGKKYNFFYFFHILRYKKF
jgi:hypothetical protein